MHKKRIVFVINNFLIGGVERFLFDIISNFDKEKYNVQIVTVLGSGPLESSFRNIGIPIYFAGSKRSKSVTLPFKLYWILIAPLTIIRIIFFFLKSKPDVVVTSLYQADILGMIAGKIVGIRKRILIQHDIQQFGKVVKVVKKKFAINLSTSTVAISSTVKDFLVNYFHTDSNKIVVILNGIDFENFKKGNKTAFNLSNPVFGIIGRLEEVKGHQYALEAFKMLKEKHNLSPSLFIAGSGSLSESLEKYTIINNLSNIKFFGNILNVPEFLSKIDILIIPSIEEGLGLVVLEGLVANKIIIASDIGALRELIVPGKNGFLFKVKNVDSLLSTILNILNNKNLVTKMQSNISLFIKDKEEQLDIKRVSKVYQNIFFNP